MAPLKLLSLASASLVLFAANTEGTEPTYKAEFGELVCLNEANAARQAAGLTPFAKSDEHEEAQDSLKGNGKTFCETLITDASKVTPGMIAALGEGTFAYLALEGKEPNCPAAIQKWQAAFPNFNGLPPNQTEGAELYKNQENVSFVALYNPSSTAKAECRVVTCTKEVANLREKSEEKASALLCLTAPPAIGEKVLFEEGQWENITKVFTGSASSAVPTFLVAVIALAGVALF